MSGEKLTKRVVDALKAPEPSKVRVKVRESFSWDRELRGFGVQVTPSGLKSFVIQYRNAEGRNRRTVIGRFGLMTVEEARRVAHEKLVAVSKGLDPAAEQAARPARRPSLRCATGICARPKRAASWAVADGPSRPRRSPWTAAASSSTSSRCSAGGA